MAIKRATIVACERCGQKLRLPLLNKSLRVKCRSCGYAFRFDQRALRAQRRTFRLTVALAAVIVLLPSITAPIGLKSLSDALLARAEQEYDGRLADVQAEYQNELAAVKEEHERRIADIDVVTLRSRARARYERIWEERNRYSSKYALSPREKSLLRMRSLAADRTRGMADIIISIAAEAAPENSDVNVLMLDSGITLDIDFDMSEVTRGEEGTRTKHSTKDSLRREVIRLISRVTLDVYQLCEDFDLESIVVGCRHVVINTSEGRDINSSTMVVYKVRLDKKELRKLQHNPFLDLYSTTESFKIVTDEFPTLRIREAKP